MIWRCWMAGRLIRLQDSLISYDPDYFIDNIILRMRNGTNQQ